MPDDKPVTEAEDQTAAAAATDEQPPAADPGATDQNDEAKIWAEFDAAETDPAAIAPPAETQDKSTSGKGVADAAGKGAGAATTTEPDIWTDAPEPLRAEYQTLKADADRLVHAQKSDRGRIAALQRQVEDLQQRPAAGATNRTGNNGAANGSAERAADTFVTSQKWKDFGEEYPEIAGPLGEVISGLQQEVADLKGGVSAINSDRRQGQLNEQERLLADTHPDWKEVTADAALSDWLRSQPRHVREAAQRNGEGIVDAEEAADVVGRFKAWRAAQAGNGHEDPAAKAGNGHGSPNNAAPTLSNRRQRQLESASGTRSRSPSAAVGIPDDPKGAWDAFERIDAERARQGLPPL